MLVWKQILSTLLIVLAIGAKFNHASNIDLKEEDSKKLEIEQVEFIHDQINVKVDPPNLSSHKRLENGLRTSQQVQKRTKNRIKLYLLYGQLLYYF